jgi:hypothetical protein
VDIINQWAIFRGLEGPLLTEHDLRLEFPSVPSNLSSANTVTRSVHCECTLLMDLLKSALATGQTSGLHVQIGVSKSVCVLCGVYMDLIMREYPHINITVSTHHGKKVAGWRVPLVLHTSPGLEMRNSMDSSFLPRSFTISARA